MDFHISENAAKQIKKLIKQDKAKGMRVSVEGGGCSGFRYEFSMETKVSSEDKIFSHDGAIVIIDPISLEFVQDSTIDFIEELGGSYFVINNPAATGKCGCGNSFSV